MAQFRTRLSLTFIWIALLATGCSSFNRDWKAAAAAASPATSMAGVWEGTWKSDASSHHDRLRCLIRPVSENQFEARFRAHYRKIIHFSYTVNLTGGVTNGVFHFRGEENLGRLAGGIYHYEGDASATNFFSTYHCRYDHGTFQMSRPR